MKEALLRKRYGVPAALLILLVLVGVATAITYQGESDNIEVTVQSLSMKHGYGVFVDVDIVEGQVDSITYPEPPTGLISTEQDEGVGDVNNDGDRWDARYIIPPNEGIKVTVDPADDAAPDNLEVNRGFERKAKY